MRVIRFLSFAMALLAYLVWRHFAAQVYVGDLPPFDLAPYDYFEALTYVDGLSDEARAVYLGPLHRADLALMLALTVALILPVWRWVLALPAVAYLGFDLLENRMVSGLLQHGLHEMGQIATLNVVTGLKFGFLCTAALIAGWALWRGARGGR